MRQLAATFLVYAAGLLAFGVDIAVAQTASLSSEPAAAALRERLSELIGQLPKATEVGFAVVDADGGTTWFVHQTKLPLKPASVMKLFVTAAALERFGPDFAYRTRVYVRNGELLVLGSGDPGLGDERVGRRHSQAAHAELGRWARGLLDRGVTALKTIALDDSVFDRQHRHLDWPDDQAQEWYQAPVGGINFNDNCLDARLTVAGDAVRLFLQPDLPASFFRNELRISAEHEPVVKRPLDQDVFEFSGPVARDHQFEPISVRRPTAFFGYALRRALKEHGITLNGNVVRRGITTAALADADLLDAHGTSLPDVMWRCNTFSQNLFAECLLKSLAAYDRDGNRSGVRGTWTAGVQILRATLEDLGLDLTGAVLRDGSGLSHGNRLSAEQVVRLLVIMRHHSHAALFVESLAEPGQEGSMRHRYATATLRGRLRAKTGTLRGARALAGYATRSDGTTLAFALLVNGRVSSTWLTHAVEALIEADGKARP